MERNREQGEDLCVVPFLLPQQFQQTLRSHHHHPLLTSSHNDSNKPSDPTTTTPCRPPPIAIPTNPRLLGFLFAMFSKQYQILNPTYIRHFYNNPPDDSGTAGVSEFRHQEITGPTVERNISALPNETRETLKRLRKSIYDLITSLVILDIAQLTLDAWIVYTVPTNIPKEVLIEGLMAFAFPFLLAFLT